MPGRLAAVGGALGACLLVLSVLVLSCSSLLCPLSHPCLLPPAAFPAREPAEDVADASGQSTAWHVLRQVVRTGMQVRLALSGFYFGACFILHCWSCEVCFSLTQTSTTGTGCHARVRHPFYFLGAGAGRVSLD